MANSSSAAAAARTADNRLLARMMAGTTPQQQQYRRQQIERVKGIVIAIASRLGTFIARRMERLQHQYQHPTMEQHHTRQRAKGYLAAAAGPCVMLFFLVLFLSSGREDQTHLKDSLLLQKEHGHQQTNANMKTTVEIFLQPDPNKQFTTDCSCYNRNTDRKCCDRAIRAFHKMGYEVSQEVFHNYYRSHQSHLRFDAHKARTSAPPPPIDYRDIVIARNVYEALMSGYLYHQSGRECWLDPYGNTPVPSFYATSMAWNNGEWIQIIKDKSNAPQNLKDAVTQFAAAFKSGEGVLNPSSSSNNATSSMCAFLATQPEDIGMHIFIEVMFAMQYQKVLDNYQFAASAADHNRTLFVCFEELVNQPRETVQIAIDFLYPGIPDTAASRDGKGGGGRRRQLTRAWKDPSSPSYQGHATTHDPAVRDKLKALIQTLDDTVLDHRIASAQATLQCGP